MAGSASTLAQIGVTAVSEMGLVTFTARTSMPPMLTVVIPATKFVPVTVMVVPPLVGPADGLTPVSVGCEDGGDV